MTRVSGRSQRGKLQSLQELVVLRVGSNPEPHDEVSTTTTQGAVVLVHAHRPDIRVERLEMEGRVESVLPPEAKPVACQSLNLLRERIEAGPEIRVRPGNHGSSGRFP